MSSPRPTENAAQTPNSGHDAKGRFTHGNKGGPGNPYARQVAALRKVILNRLTEEDLLAITEALLAKAKEGSVGAAKLLLSYALGKPAPAPDPDRLDGQELEHFKGQVQAVNAVRQVAGETERALDPYDPFAKQAGMSDDYRALLYELRGHPEKYDHYDGVRAMAKWLEEADINNTGEEPTWLPPSTNGPFGMLPPRIRQLAQGLFDLEPPSPNGDLQPPEEKPGD